MAEHGGAAGQEKGQVHPSEGPTLSKGLWSDGVGEGTGPPSTAARTGEPAGQWPPPLVPKHSPIASPSPCARVDTLACVPCACVYACTECMCAHGCVLCAWGGGSVRGCVHRPALPSGLPGSSLASCDWESSASPSALLSAALPAPGPEVRLPAPTGVGTGRRLKGNPGITRGAGAVLRRRCLAGRTPPCSPGDGIRQEAVGAEPSPPPHLLLPALVPTPTSAPI